MSIATPLKYDVVVLGQLPSAVQPSTVYFSGYNGHSYVETFSDYGGYGDFSFMSMHTYDLALLVGYGGTLRISLAQGMAWQNLLSGTQNDLFGADSPDGSVCYIVGSKGTLRKGVGPSYVNWKALNSTTFARLTSVWFVDANQGYIIGDGGTALRTTDGGVNWTPMPVNTTVNLNAVRFLDATTGFIAGDLGTLLLTTDGGQSWHPEVTNTFETLNGIYATPDGLTTWVVGGGGTVLKHGPVTATPLAGRSATIEPTWQAYPNPFTTALTLSLPRTTKSAEVRLFDPLGRVVLHQTVNSTATAQASYQLPVPADLASGVYTLQVTTPEQASQTRRLVRLP